MLPFLLWRFVSAVDWLDLRQTQPQTPLLPTVIVCSFWMLRRREYRFRITANAM